MTLTTTGFVGVVALFVVGACSSPDADERGPQPMGGAGAGSMPIGMSGAGSSTTAGGKPGSAPAAGDGARGSDAATSDPVSVGMADASIATDARAQPDGDIDVIPQRDSVLSHWCDGCVVRPDNTLACWNEALQPDPDDTLVGTYDAVYVQRDLLADRCAHSLSGGYGCLASDTSVRPPAGRDYAFMVLGREFACGLTDDGSAECWGDVPAGVQATGTYQAIVSPGSNTFCGLRSDGTISCWNDGMAELENLPSGERFVQVSIGVTLSCGLTPDSRLVCWGVLGQRATFPEKGVRAISVADAHGCAVFEDDHVECFTNDSDALRPGVYEPPPAGVRFAIVQAGVYANCGISVDAEVWCWGWDLPARRMLGEDGDPLVAKLP